MNAARGAAADVPRHQCCRIVLAIILAAAANTYLGLFAGMTIASAIPAAVVSMAVLRVLGGGTHPREQHRADRRLGRLVDRLGRDLHVPALVILGHWTDFQYAWVLAIAGLGGILGVFFSVPLRRVADRRAEPDAFPKAWRRPRCSRPATTRRRA